MKFWVFWCLIYYGVCEFHKALGDSVNIEDQQIRHIDQAVNFEMLQDFREPKKILFSSMFGGSSHVHWVLSILDNLSSRGHNISFVTKDSHMKFSRGFPQIKTISISGKDGDSHNGVLASMKGTTELVTKTILTRASIRSLELDLGKFIRIMEDKQYDVAVCDHFNNACLEAAYKFNIPTIITSSITLGEDAGAPYINNDALNIRVPTTEFMNFWERVELLVIRPLRYTWNVLGTHAQMNRVLESHGCQPWGFQELRWLSSMKMYNTAFGIQRARPLGPMVEFVGPILNTRIAKLTPTLDTYLNDHKKVAYIGFGQNVNLSTKDIELILTGLLEAYEHKDLDGIIWASRNQVDLFPEIIVTQSNKTYNIREIYSGEDQGDILFLSWAPQMAILIHPSTVLNINHGGSASIYESLYAGVRMIIYPFNSDQPGAAITTERNGYGLRLSSEFTQSEATKVIRTVARDEHHQFQKNATRFKSLIQIRSKHAIIRGADLVEEVLFMNQNGKLTHRRDVKQDISFWKATNWDVYVFTAAVAACIVYFLLSFGYCVIKNLLCQSSTKKQKKL